MRRTSSTAGCYNLSLEPYPGAGYRSKGHHASSNLLVRWEPYSASPARRVVLGAVELQVQIKTLKLNGQMQHQGWIMCFFCRRYQFYVWHGTCQNPVRMFLALVCSATRRLMAAHGRPSIYIAPKRRSPRGSIPSGKDAFVDGNLREALPRLTCSAVPGLRDPCVSVHRRRVGYD